MGYSKNPSTLEKIRHLLADVEAGLSSQWQVEASTEDYWAYKFREALSIAGRYPERYPELAAAAKAFKITVPEPGLILAIPATNTTEPEHTAYVAHGLDDSTPSTFWSQRSVNLLGPQTAITIADSWFHTQPNNKPLYFPDAALSTDELLALHRWTRGQNLIFFESDGAITVQHRTQDLADLAWAPADLPGESFPELDNGTA